MPDPYRILALDGGGLRGTFTAAVLAELEAEHGAPFLEAFDLLVGTSTGGILALGLASGRTCEQMLDFYRVAGPEIFARPRRLRRLWGPKYDRRRLDGILRKELGEDTRLRDLTKPVCITAFELVRGTPRVWKDDHHEHLFGGGEQLAWKVAAATSAAPTYFAPVQLGQEDSHIDGGVWSNNPAMVGITEAIRYGGTTLDGVRLLSVGTTSSPLRFASARDAERLGLFGWGRRGVDLLQGSVGMAVDNQARLLLHDDHYLRIDSESARKVRLDDARRCAALQEWGRQAARENRRAVAALLEA